MQIQKILDEFYRQFKLDTESRESYIVIKSRPNIQLGLQLFNEQFPSFTNLLISEFNKNLGMPGKYNPINYKLIYKRSRPKQSLIKIIDSFFERYINCAKCKLRYTILDNKQIKCTACGHIKHV